MHGLVSIDQFMPGTLGKVRVQRQHTRMLDGQSGNYIDTITLSGEQHNER